MLEALQPVWNGLVVGSIVALAALGFTLIFGIMNFLHVAYAEYITLGGYIAFVANVTFGAPITISFILGTGGMAICSVVLYWVLFKRFSAVSPVILLIVSLALGIILQNVVRIGWGTNSLRYDIPIRRATDVAGLKILPVQLIIIFTGVVIMVGLVLLLRHTRIGIAMRASSDDLELARIRGVNTGQVVTFTWVVTGAIAGATGIFLGTEASLLPLLGFSLLPSIFAAVVLGGVGDPTGAIIGGYAIGLAEELSVLVISSQYKPAIGLIVLVIVLLVKPQGVFGMSTR